jgi:hypothetical protein
MFNTLSWLLLGLPTGYVLMDLIDHYHYKIYNTNISNYCKYNIIMTVILLALLKGYTGNDLFTNIQNWSLLGFNIRDIEIICQREYLR